MLKVGDKVTVLENHYISNKQVVSKDTIYKVVGIEHFKYTDDYAVKIELGSRGEFGLMSDEVVKVKHEVVE